MKTKENNYNFTDIIEYLEDISKHLYLESPELWIDFSDKISDEIIDEMVLFYATKYNHHQILKFVVDNNIIDLNNPSRNKNFTSIKTHLIAASTEYKSTDVYQLLTNNMNLDINIKKENKISHESSSTKDGFTPNFICSSCGKNIFEHGFKVLEEVNYIYNNKNQLLLESSRTKKEPVFCSSCNNHIKTVTFDTLEKLCSISNCTKCGEDLTKVGIDQKIKMNFNNNVFVPSKEFYVCSCCQTELNKSQLEFFNI